MTDKEELAWRILREAGLAQNVAELRVYEDTAEFARYITEERVFIQPGGRNKRWTDLLPDEQAAEWARTDHVVKAAAAETFLSCLEPVAVKIAFNMATLFRAWAESDTLYPCRAEQRFEHAVIHEGIHGRDFVRAEPGAFDYRLIKPFVLTAEALALLGTYDIYRQRGTADLDCYIRGYLHPLLASLFELRLLRDNELTVYEFGQIAGIGLVYDAHRMTAESEYIEDLYDKLLMELLVPEFNRVKELLQVTDRLTLAALTQVRDLLEATMPLVQYRFRVGLPD